MLIGLGWAVWGCVVLIRLGWGERVGEGGRIRKRENICVSRREDVVCVCVCVSMHVQLSAPPCVCVCKYMQCLYTYTEHVLVCEECG